VHRRGNLDRRPEIAGIVPLPSPILWLFRIRFQHQKRNRGLLHEIAIAAHLLLLTFFRCQILSWQMERSLRHRSEIAIAAHLLLLTLFRYQIPS
jgi:hypothetical protein